MKQKLTTAQNQGHSTNMLLVAVAADSNLSTDGTALDCVSGLRGSGIGATSEDCLLSNVDCYELLKSLPDNSIDLIIQDPPYGTTQLKWDKPVNYELMWPEWLRVAKENAAIIFTASQPFTTDLIVSQRKYFRYEMVWHKTQVSGFLDANKRPLKCHENVIVFYRKQPTYNPQKTFAGTPSLRTNNIGGKRGSKHYGEFKNPKQNGTTDGSRFPQSVVSFSNWNGALFGDTNNAVKHPTQKPVDLFRYLIKMYSNENDVVFDGYSGSGTTAIACLNEGRKFIGAELNEKYFNDSIKRIAHERSQLSMF